MNKPILHHYVINESAAMDAERVVTTNVLTPGDVPLIRFYIGEDVVAQYPAATTSWRMVPDEYMDLYRGRANKEPEE